jgi:acetyltransferase-like isoleucine patch superfamily enzyme
MLNKKTIKILSFLLPTRRLRKKFRAFLRGGVRNNRIIIIRNGKEHKKRFFEIIRGLDIFIIGNNNVVKIEFPFRAHKSSITIENNNTLIEIGSTKNLHNLNINSKGGTNQVCKIGKNTAIVGVEIWLGSGSNCIIGDNCMFSYNIIIQTTDCHKIMDKETREIINRQKHPLIIGNNCWIGHDVLITKNAKIPDNTVVGAGSVVAKVFEEENTVIAGNTAKVIKTNVVWSTDPID